MYREILINAKVKRGQEAKTTGRNTLIRGRSTMDCSAIEGEEDEEVEEQG